MREATPNKGMFEPVPELLFPSATTGLAAMSLTYDQIGMNIASLAGWSLFGALEYGPKVGLGAIELLGFSGARHSQGDLPGAYVDQLNDAERAQLVEATAPFARKAVHAPFADLPLISYHPDVQALASEAANLVPNRSPPESR